MTSDRRRRPAPDPVGLDHLATLDAYATTTTYDHEWDDQGEHELWWDGRPVVTVETSGGRL